MGKTGLWGLALLCGAPLPAQTYAGKTAEEWRPLVEVELPSRSMNKVSNEHIAALRALGCLAPDDATARAFHLNQNKSIGPLQLAAYTSAVVRLGPDTLREVLRPPLFVFDPDSVALVADDPVLPRLLDGLGNIGVELLEPVEEDVLAPVMTRVTEDPQRRSKALAWFSAQAPELPSAVPLLLRLAHDDDKATADAARIALARVGTGDALGAVDAYLATLGSRNEWQPEPEESLDLEGIIAGLRSDDANAFRAATGAVMVHGSAAAPVIPAIVELLRDLPEGGADRAQPWAMRAMRLGAALARVGAPAGPAARTLVESDHPFTQSLGNGAASHVGPEHMFTCAELASVIDGAAPDHWVQALAQAMVVELRDLPDWLKEHSRANAIVALGGHPELTTSEVRRLVGCLDDDKEVIRQAAVIGLARAGKKAFPFVLERLASGTWQRTRRQALDVLERMGAEGLPALATLTELALPGSEDRLQAIRILGQLGPAAKRAVPLLVDALSSPDWETRHNAARSLGNCGDERARAALAELSDDPDHAVREAANDALADLRDRLPPVLGDLDDRDPVRRGRAVLHFARSDRRDEFVAAVLARLSVDDPSARSGGLEALYFLYYDHAATSPDAIPERIRAAYEQYR